MPIAGQSFERLTPAVFERDARGERERAGGLGHQNLVVGGSQWGRVRALIDDQGVTRESAGPSTPVEILGFSGSPEAGDRVAVNPNLSCGRCEYCQRGIPSHCQTVGGIGWIFGHLIDGLQAEYARVPYAETSVHKVPEGVTDTQVLFLTDILPTGYEVGVRNGRVKPGDTVAVVVPLWCCCFPTLRQS